MCTRGKLIGIHRDWMKTWVSDVCWFLIHRDWIKTRNSDVFYFGDFRRYIGTGLYWPIPMYYLDIFGPSYIGMGIEISIPMYRLLKLE